MATMTNDTIHASLGAATSTPGRLAERFNRWASRRREIARVSFELNCYTDRQLSDLGLSRADIPDVARGRFRRA